MSPERDTALRRVLVLIGIPVALTMALAGCGPTPEASGGGAASDQGCGTEVPFDPGNFVDPWLDTNPYHPLEPGLQWVRGGSTLVGGREVPHEIITTMTDVIRVIDGVPTIAMLDESTDSGEVSQVGFDYLALDRDGNVWILGGYTEEFQGGVFTNSEDAWLGNADQRTVGILVPAEVTMTTPVWCIGQAAGEAGSVGQVVEVASRECIAFGCYDHVRVVQEGDVGAPDNENKSYAAGIGVINNIPLDASLHQDRFQLQNFLRLSAAGLAAASHTVLDLEAHARTVTAPDVFGPAPESTRLNP